MFPAAYPVLPLVIASDAVSLGVEQDRYASLGLTGCHYATMETFFVACQPINMLTLIFICMCEVFWGLS